MSITSKTVLVTALAGLLLAPAARAEEKKSGEAEKSPCWGINKCKGVGDCGAEGCRHSGCHGSNGCRGQGFLRLEKETCLKIENGRLTKAADASPASRPAAKPPAKADASPAKRDGGKDR